MNKSASYKGICIIVQEIGPDFVKYVLGATSQDNKRYTWEAGNHMDRHMISKLRVGGRYWVDTKSDGRGRQHWLGFKEMNKQLKKDNVITKSKIVKPVDKHVTDRFVEY